MLLYHDDYGFAAQGSSWTEFGAFSGDHEAIPLLMTGAMDRDMAARFIIQVIERFGPTRLVIPL